MTPLAGPAPANRAGGEDRQALLVVVDAFAVAERASAPEPRESGPQVAAAKADQDRGASPLGRRPPEPVVVVAAVRGGKADGRPIAIDRSGLAIVGGEDHGRAPLVRRQRVVGAGDLIDHPRPPDRLAEVVVDV